MFALAWLLISGPVRLPERLRAEGLALAHTRLAEAGYPWARVEVEEGLGRLKGVAPSEAARVGLQASAAEHLGGLVGPFGIVQSLESEVRLAPGLDRDRLSLRMKDHDLMPVEEAPTSFGRPATAEAPESQVSLAGTSTGSGGCSATALAALEADDTLRFESGEARWMPGADAALDALAAGLRPCASAGKVMVYAAGEGRLGSSHRQALIASRIQTTMKSLAQRGVTALQSADPQMQSLGQGRVRPRARGVAFEVAGPGVDADRTR